MARYLEFRVKQGWLVRLRPVVAYNENRHMDYGLSRYTTCASMPTVEGIKNNKVPPRFE